MYPVSSAYLDAIAQPNREFKIEVLFKYKDGTKAVFDDSTIKGEVKIESQCVSGSASCNVIDVGAVPTARASLTVIEDDTNLRRYAGAEFSITVSLKLESGKYESVPMGTFYVDISKTSRIGNKIEIYGYDAMVSLVYDLSSNYRTYLKGMSVHNAVDTLVAPAACGFQQDFSELPNNNLFLDFSSTQIVTARDAIMWIAQLMGCFARINRQNNLEFVPIKSTWKYYNDEQTIGTIIAARTIGGSERRETKFSDDRIHIAGITMPGDDGLPVKITTAGLESDSNVIVSLEQNPLIISSSTSNDTILKVIFNQIKTTYFYAFRSEIINDPALDAGDTIRLQGGLINGTNRNEDLIGFITHNVWRYRGWQEVVNTGQTAINFDGSTTSALPSIVPSSSQSEKAVNHSIAQSSTPPNWIGESGNIGLQVRGISAWYDETVMDGLTTHINRVTGSGAELSARKKNATTYYANVNLASSMLRVYNSKYELSLGTPEMKFFDILHNLGFKWRHKAQTVGSPADQLELYFGGDDSNSKVILRYDGKNKILRIDGVSQLFIDGHKVFDTEDHTT